MRSLIITLIIAFGFSPFSCKTQDKINCNVESKNPEYDKAIKKYLSCSVPTISVQELQNNYSEYVILDARELEEYDISHLPTAVYFGYKKPDWSVLDNLNKERKILVYCSIGYRSEKITEKIQAKGYNAYNLYGSIFEWVNNELPVYDLQDNEVNKIHGYNKSWSKWVSNTNYEISY